MCRNGGEGNTAVRDTVVLGVAASAALVMLIIAGAEYNNWLPMINLAFVVAVPAAIVLSDVFTGGASYSGYDEGRAAWGNFGACFFGTVLASLFGLPLVLLHTGQLQGPEFGLWMASTGITFLTGIWYWISRHSKSEY